MSQTLTSGDNQPPESINTYRNIWEYTGPGSSNWVPYPNFDNMVPGTCDNMVPVPLNNNDSQINWFPTNHLRYTTVLRPRTQIIHESGTQDNYFDGSGSKNPGLVHRTEDQITSLGNPDPWDYEPARFTFELEGINNLSSKIDTNTTVAGLLSQTSETECAVCITKELRTADFVILDGCHHLFCQDCMYKLLDNQNEEKRYVH